MYGPKYYKKLCVMHEAGSEREWKGVILTLRDLFGSFGPFDPNMSIFASIYLRGK